jgi:hypothetical protein
MCVIRTSFVHQATARQSPQRPGRNAAVEQALWPEDGGEDSVLLKSSVPMYKT